MGGGKGGGGGGSTTTVQKADPWIGQQAFLSDVFAKSAQLYKDGGLAPAYYSGNTVAAQSPWTQQSLQLQADRALNGSPIIDVATNGMQNIMSGNALAQNQGLQTLNQLASADNPYTDELYNRANSQMLASMDSNFNRAGRYGSGAHAAAAADASGNLANQMYSALYDKRESAANKAGTLYNQGIGQQVLGSSQAQNLGNQAYTDAAALSEAGGVQDDYNQTLINAAIDRYNYEAQRPLTALSNYNQLIQGNYGGTSTTTGKVSQGQKNVLGNVAGGAMSGAGIGASFGPWGALAGGVGGGLLGLFSSL